MEKTIKVDSKTSFVISNNIGWLMDYQNQFGRDVLQTLEPVLISGVGLYKAIQEAATETGVPALEIARRLDADALREAVIDLSGLGAVDAVNIIWAMAKAADPDIPEPREWVRQFERFPLDTILPAAADCVLSGLLTTKKYKGLRDMMRAPEPSPSTAS